MPSLSNDLLREKTMREFLTAMDIDIVGVDVSSTEGLFSFNFKDKKLVDVFATKLDAVLKLNGAKKAVRTINLSDIIDHNVLQAVCDDEKLVKTHREACSAILKIIKATAPEFKYLKETGEIEITLPCPEYSVLLKILRYPHLRLTEAGKVAINLKGYLKTQPAEVVIMEGLNSIQSPLVFVNDSAIQSKSIFYAFKQLPDFSTQITPYFFVPQTTTPPDYHLVLDVSLSMDCVVDNTELSALALLKSSVIRLTEQLFQFQPDAKVSITTFSQGVHFHGTYSRAQSTIMNDLITGLKTRDTTPLHEAAADAVKKITSSPGKNNILLFTDGIECGSKPGSKDELNQLITTLQNDMRIVARNKFNLFNYGTASDDVVSDVVKTFQSEAVDTLSPDFMNAQTDPELMKRWAVSRDLFTARVIVEDKAKGKNGDESTTMMLNMSGQLQALKPRICKPGEVEKVDISITDGDDRIIAKSTMTFPVVAVPAGAAVPSGAAAPSVTITVPAQSAGLMPFFKQPAAAPAPRASDQKDVKTNCS